MKDAGKNGLVYLDHSATTPVDPDVARQVYEAMLEGWGNPSSRYQLGNEARLSVELARERVASLLGAHSQDLFFTSGGTEADNLALLGIGERGRIEGRPQRIVISPIEHSAVAKAARSLQAQGFEVMELPIGPGGVIDPADLEEALDKPTLLVSVMHVNNEIGTIQPVEELGRICAERGVRFHVDAVQSFGKLPVSVEAWAADAVAVSSHKIYGPKGVGALWLRPGVEIETRQKGGGQERGLRTGTENVPGIVGFGHAAALCGERMEQEAEALGALRDRLYRWIEQELDGDVALNGDAKQRIHMNLNLRFDGVEAESLLLALDLDNIAVSTGSACSSGSTKPSSVLLALGLSEHEAHSSLRLTLGRSNDEEELRYAAERIGHHVRKLRSMAL